MTLRPYYDHAGITLYHADCREVLPELVSAGQRFGAMLTDPVWPGAKVALTGSDRPVELFREAVTHAPKLADRLCVQIGRDTDPRFLTGVPAELPYFATCWLRYDVPGYKGRVLICADILHVFGAAPPVRKHGHVVPGEASGNSARAVKNVKWHPCPRRYDHVRWQVEWFAGGGAVIDPFAGSGTTLVAARDYGVPAVGIEIEERFCEGIVKRLEQEMLFQPKREVAPKTVPLFGEA